MAIKTITLRPTGSEYPKDPGTLSIDIASMTYPATSDVGEIYLRVNEEVSDGDSTYYTSHHLYGSSIGFSFTVPEKYRWSIPVALRIYLNSTSANDSQVALTSWDISSGVAGNVNIITYTIPASSTYSAFEYSAPGTIIENMWSRIASWVPSISLPVICIGMTKNGSSKTANAKITQFYIEADFEVEESSGIYVRKNGAFVEVAQTYKKVSGAWTEITTEECKSLIQSHS